ncbi:MAG: META domain-containing protein [Anaerolineales bacterium]|jgi:heat shock protein HslJ
MKRISIAILVLTIAALAGCGGAQSANPLIGSSWSLTQLNGHSLVSGTRIEINFERDSFSGTACNHFGGQYTADGDRFSIPGPMEMTAMACLDPEGIMEQEQEFGAALATVVSYQVSGNKLEMLDESGAVVLVFNHETSASIDPDSLINSEWRVTRANDESLIPDSQITMRFSSSGVVNGFGGCRGYEAEYIKADEGVRFTSIAMNEEPCNDETLLIQEQDFTDYLSDAKNIERVGDFLILKTLRGDEVVFEPIE